MDEPDLEEYAQKPLLVLNRYLIHLHRAQPDRRYILVLDEYEVLESSLSPAEAREFVTTLRGLTQQYPWLVMALVGLHTLQERTADFYEAIFAWRPLKVGFLDEDGVAAVLEPERDDFPLSYDREAVALIYSLTGGQPFLVQLLGDSLIQKFNEQLRRLTAPSATFTAADVQATIDDPRFYAQGNGYFTGIWGQAEKEPAGQHLILQKLAPYKEGLDEEALQQACAAQLSGPAFRAALTALSVHDMIVAKSRVYVYTVELLRRWVEEVKGKAV